MVRSFDSTVKSGSGLGTPIFLFGSGNHTDHEDKGFIMLVDMHDPDLIWRFGRWTARRETGKVRFTNSGGEIVLEVIDGKAVSVQGLDPTEVARRLGTSPAGNQELLDEAAAIAEEHGIPEAQAVGIVKEMLQEAVAEWMADPDRRLDLVPGDILIGDGPTISMTHVVVEMVLSDQGGRLAQAILPDTDVLLKRTEGFLELYSPLRLSEEADLIVAKVTGQRTAREISSRSPHGSGEVDSLIAALVATGMLEPTALADVEVEPRPAVPVVLPKPEPQRTRVPIWALLGTLAVVLAVVALLTAWWNRSYQHDVEPAITGAEWALVVDMGCEPQELQRVLKKARQHPRDLKPVAAEAGEDSPCWRLVWGRFPNREAANQAIAGIPSDLLMDGFTPHAIELPTELAIAPPTGGEE